MATVSEWIADMSDGALHRLLDWLVELDAFQSVVGQDAFDDDSVAPEEGERPLQKGGRALLLLAGQDFGASQPRGVVDSDVESFPAQALSAGPAVALAAPVADDALADAIDAAGLLGVEVKGSVRRASPARSG